MTSVTHIVSEKIILKINENLPNMLTICLNSDNVSIAEMGNVLFSNDTKHQFTHNNCTERTCCKGAHLRPLLLYIGLHCYGSLRMESLFTIAQTMSAVVIILNLHCRLHI